MAEVWALVPAKSPARSKSRLRSVLPADDCAQLSHAMLQDVLAALEGAASVDRIAVLTDADEVAHFAAGAGHRVIRDAGDELCAALDQAAAELARQGATTIIVLPGDIPTITSADIDGLLAGHQTGLSLCPAIRDGGTNALVCTPPDAVPFCFGADSAARHLQAAAAHGLQTSRRAMPAFFRDIDLPDDLVWLNAQAAGSHTQDYLRQSGLSARLGPAFLSAAG
ncbi:MAG: 2-phospho-L-lactate guanylyltransferase [Gammaproteobacteria bacterium]|jgi:2-phospho-L-lactate guanylyltransferase|nr:2-phospho-L-lactate guanylyltransferase [Gammaproteobacteria bacterium]